MKKTSGQALLELAVFGSLILYLLGILINYGLRYNWQQRVNQRAFRMSLSDSVHSTEPDYPVATSNLVIRDVHIPSPPDVFGVGSVTPIMGSADPVYRSWLLYDDSSNTVDEEPRMVMDINKEIYNYTTGKDGKISGLENSTQVTTLDNTLIQDDGGTSDSFNWQVSTSRSIVCEDCVVPGPAEVISVLQPDLKSQAFR